MAYKLCPMSFNLNGSCRNCIKEQCEWWNKEEKNCAISMLAHYVSMLWEHRYNTER